eukprot:TRINITY_DN1482_c2_g2_i1.p1 TRINITY_DN1482_c2_g2~~TRINITY_DN1482_c2_g2_i1.p1  ORF type:complete len:359 (-),score=55.04 TRINITY_DN1482_c2_g2_i1:49-1125(-)
MASPCGNVTLGCNRGVCINPGPRCFCPPFQFGVDCGIGMSEFLGHASNNAYHACFFIIWLFVTVVASLMLISMIRNGKIVKILLHKIGIIMIFLAALGRLIFLIATWANDDLVVDLILLERLVIPVLVSVFVFQIFIWFEATRAVLNDKITTNIVNAKKRIYGVAFCILTIFFVLQFVQDSYAIAGTTDYYQYNFMYGNILGAVVFVIAIAFWICWCIISKAIRKLQISNGRLDSNAHIAVAPFAMSFCATVTITFGLSSFGLNQKVPANWLLVQVPLRLAEWGYCVLFLLFMGLPTYKKLWEMLRGRLSTGGSSKSRSTEAPLEGKSMIEAVNGSPTLGRPKEASESDGEMVVQVKT